MGPLWLVPALPLAAFAACALLPRKLVRLSGVISSLASGIALVLMVGHFVAVLQGRIPVSLLLEYNVAGRHAQLALAADPLASIMGLLVAATATVVLFYSVGYMRGEFGQRRFFAEMSLFVSAMLTLVLASNYLLLYAAWEVVGLCSYLLIGHYWKEDQARRGSLKAFSVTRIGDLGLLLGIALIFLTVGTTTYERVFSAVHANVVPPWALTAIPFLLLAGAVGKAAQFPLHLWLPDAMAGPTPVSALIHSATMVAAGIYLVARSFPLFQATPVALTFFLALASITALGAAMTACVQTDVKRLLAYSTISQLGEMGIALGLGAPVAGIFHLISHASFKALLFLTAGIVTKEVGGNDLARLRTGSAAARYGFLIGALSLSGIPPFAGFWSKDAIAKQAGPEINLILSVLSVLGAFYISRAYLLGFTRKLSQGSNENGTPRLMEAAVWIMVLATLTVGLVESPIGDGWLGKFLGSPANVSLDAASAIHPFLALLGWTVALAMYRWRVTDPNRLVEHHVSLHRLLSRGLGTDSAGLLAARAGIAFARTASTVDTKTFERFSNAAGEAALRVARSASRLDVAVFDRFATSMTDAALRLASRASRFDLSGIEHSVEASAARISSFGARVRALQTGRVYHYLAPAFGWVLALALIVLVVLL